MTYREIIEKAVSMDEGQFNNFGVEIQGEQEDCKVSYSPDYSEKRNLGDLISLRGEFGNIRLISKNGNIEIFLRVYGDYGATPFKDEKISLEVAINA